MKPTKKRTSPNNKKKFPWRTNKEKWTDTMFDFKLLANPSLMTNLELAKALEEHQKWRTGTDKYLWEVDPIKENREIESPFSPAVLSRIICEVIVRLQIGGDLAMGRFKGNAE